MRGKLRGAEIDVAHLVGKAEGVAAVAVQLFTAPLLQSAASTRQNGTRRADEVFTGIGQRPAGTTQPTRRHSCEAAQIGEGMLQHEEHALSSLEARRAP